jgi:geranylgeranyl diphosphate synthase type II
MHLFNQTAIEVCEGQQMDMDFETREQVTIEEYIEMIRLKTSVLLGCAMKMGAIIGEASAEHADLLYNIGMNLGVGFQIQDDLLDLFGDEQKVGKQSGGDVMANKKTFLSISARNQASEEQLLKLDGLQEYYNAVAKVDLTKQIFEELNIEKQATDAMNFYYQKAEDDLNVLSASVDTTVLKQFLELVRKRTY